MEMISAFTDVLHVANINSGSHLMSILKQSDAFSKDDLAKLAAKLSGRKSNIGVKKLLGLIDMVKQTDPRLGNILKISNLKKIFFSQVPSQQTAVQAGGGELYRISCVTSKFYDKILIT